MLLLLEKNLRCRLWQRRPMLRKVGWTPDRLFPAYANRRILPVRRSQHRSATALWLTAGIGLGARRAVYAADRAANCSAAS